MEQTKNNLLGNKYKQNLIAAIQSNDRNAIKLHLNTFKNEFGVVKYEALFAIPRSQRLPEIVKSTPTEIEAAVITSLTTSFESMNLVRPMNANQLFDLCDAILDSSAEDYLSLEDVLLFLQGMIRGKYGKLYESMDIPKFMEMFEIYREERHSNYLRMAEEKHSNNKAMGDNSRTSAVDQLSSAMDRMTGSLGTIKSQLK